MTNSPHIIQVEHALGAYPIIIQAGLVETIGASVGPYLRTGQAVVVSDNQIWAVLGNRLEAGLAAYGIETRPVIVPAGEASKSWTVLTELIDRLLEHECERSDTLIAFGGGMVGDLTGFAAAILKRGCRYVQVPTSLLAQVDSSVGGKTGINSLHGKNLVGAFHQPTAVLIDPTTLETLPERQLRAGYAEILKYGLIGDEPFFAWCEQAGSALIAGDVQCRTYAIGASIRAKAAIVGRDEREVSGERALLNFGHTFAHALEAQTGLGDELLHGEAVALGMTLAFRLSVERGVCDRREAERIAAHLQACGLRTELSDLGLSANGAEIAAHMRHDKKAAGGRPSLILTRGIGRAFVEDDINISEIADFLDRQLEREASNNAAVR